MAKYIDAEKLKAEINRRKSLLTQHSKLTYDLILETFIKEYDDLLSFLDSLQQEQSCDTCTNDKGCVTCKDGELWEGKEQPSDDLEAEIEMEWDSLNKHLAEYGEESEEVVWLNWNSFEDVARHFYELGKNSK